MSKVLTRLALLATATSLLAACASTPRYPVSEGEAPGTGPQMPQMPKPSYPVSSADDRAVVDRVSNQRAAAAGLAGGTLDRTTDDYAPPRAAPTGKVQVAYLTQDDTPQTVDPPGSVDAQPLGPTPDNSNVEISAPVGAKGVPTLNPRPSYSPPPPAAYSPPPASSRDEPAYSPPPPTRSAPPPKPQTKTVVSVGGPVVTVEGKPQVYTVKEGQGLDAVARALDTTRKQLADDNKLKEPYRLKPGQKLKGPVTKQKAYVVQSGDTLAAVAKRFNVTIKALAAENGLKAGAAIKGGQKLRLPDGFKDSGPVKKTVTITPPAPKPEPVYSPPPPTYSPPPPPPSVYKPPSPPPPVYRPPSPPPPIYRPPSPPPPTGGDTSTLPKKMDWPSTDEIARMGRGLFDWPVQGRVIKQFDPSKGHTQSDGWNIAAPDGAPVRAAASGTVVYAGDQFAKVLGFSVLIHHDDGSWMTSYSYMSGISDLKIGQRVSKGQIIGTVGRPPAGGEAQLHFVVLYVPVFGKEKAEPQDPAGVMPRQ